MTVRREQYFTYLLLGVFSLIALVPIVVFRKRWVA